MLAWEKEVSNSFRFNDWGDGYLWRVDLEQGLGSVTYADANKS